MPPRALRLVVVLREFPLSAYPAVCIVPHYREQNVIQRYSTFPRSCPVQMCTFATLQFSPSRLDVTSCSPPPPPSEESPSRFFTRRCKTSSPSLPRLQPHNRTTAHSQHDSRLCNLVASDDSRVAPRDSRPAELSPGAIPRPSPLASAISRFPPRRRSSLIPPLPPPRPRGFKQFSLQSGAGSNRAPHRYAFCAELDQRRIGEREGRLIKAAKSRARMQTRSILILL